MEDGAEESVLHNLHGLFSILVLLWGFGISSITKCLPFCFVDWNGWQVLACFPELTLVWQDLGLLLVLGPISAFHKRGVNSMLLFSVGTGQIKTSWLSLAK